MLSPGYVCWRCQVRTLRRTRKTLRPSWQTVRNGSALHQKEQEEGLDPAQLQVRSQSPPRRVYDAAESRLLDIFLNSTTRVPPRPRPPAGRLDLPASHERQRTAHGTDGYQSSRLQIPEVESAYARSQVVKHSEGGTTNGAPATMLSTLLDEPESLHTAWKHYLEHFGASSSPARIRPAYQDLDLMKGNTLFDKLLFKLVEAWTVDASGKLPLPSTVLDKLASVSALNVESELEAGWRIIRQLIMLDTAKAMHQQGSRSDALISELLLIWLRLCDTTTLSKEQPPHSGVVETMNWDELEVRARRLLDEGLRPANSWIELRFEKLLDPASAYPIRSLSAFALVSYDIMSRHGLVANLSVTRKAQCVAFVRALAITIHRRPVNLLLKFVRQKLHSLRVRGPAGVIKSYVKRLASLPEYTFASLARETAPAGTTVEINGVLPEAGNLTSRAAQNKSKTVPGAQKMFALLIRNAGKHQYGSRLDNVWDNIVKYYSDSAKSGDLVKIPPHIYRLILCEFCALQRGEMASKVLNFMVKNGEQLTVKEYTAMMDGYKRAKTFALVETLWNKMRAADIEPDYTAWNAKISALLHAGKQREAIQTLDEMQSAWLSAVKAHNVDSTDMALLGDMPGAVKPHISNINAILSGYAKLDRAPLHLAEDVLGWAEKIGVMPDSITFTILVQAAMRRKDFAKASRHLEQMAKAGVAPTAELFSVVLHNSFRNSRHSEMTPEESKQNAMDIVQRLKGFGWEKNRVIYQILVDYLLKKHNDHLAAMTVVRHMAKIGLEPSEHIYTAFVTHYFAQDPPDVEAVDLTVQQMSGPGMKGFVDNYLFDRIVEGYARCGEVERLKYLLRRLSNQGRRSSWSALTEALRAFVRADRHELVDDLLADLEKRRLLRWAEYGHRKVRGAEADFLDYVAALQSKR